tara:strand:+ start:1251 stop:1394 length:144 start_codon:yes stop_codon:yes gene_type:complete
MNGYGKVSKECLSSAFQSNDPKIQDLVKKEKLKGIAQKKNAKTLFKR